MWDKKVNLHPIAAAYARLHQDRIEEINALSKLIQVLSRQSKCAEADQYRPRLHELVAAGSIPDNIMVDYLNAESFFWLAQGEIHKIKQLWEEHKYLAQTPNGHMVRSWLADCMVAERRWDEALAMLRVSLTDVTTNHVQRGMIAVRIKLVAIALQQGKPEEAAEELKEISPLVSENLDRQYMAFIQNYYGCLYSMQGNIPAAQGAHQKALDLFERLGMRIEAQKVRTMLKELDEGAIDCFDLPQLP
jgi:tetratricopeptide (TPR) repeat protein